MKLHDLRPADGSRRPRTRVGRGIAAGKGKTAGRGTKGQKSRAGGKIPAWFEGGQTPLHRRIPKLRGFKNPFKVDYEVVNVGAIGELAARGAFESGDMPGSPSKSKKPAPITINQEILRDVGLVRTLSKPLKILGAGEIDTPLFVVADAFTRSATAKIEAAGGSVSILEVPSARIPAITGPAADDAAASDAADAAAPAEAAVATEVEADAEPAPTQKATPKARAPRASRSKKAANPAADADSAGEADQPAEPDSPAPEPEAD
jgi:large subunit ribosomal protein L15